METQFMAWVDRLPEVGTPILNRRDALATMIREAEQLEQIAAQLRATVRNRSLHLSDAIGASWKRDEVERAQQSPAGPAINGELAALLSHFNDTAGPLDVLRIFKAARVIRQANLFSTATQQERDDTLHRVFDWWNFAAVPLLDQIGCKEAG
ncbi:TPA: stable inheritance protein KleA [Burkholderia orbicola]